MINKEHYQIIRQHPAFAHFPVEIFDKIAIEIQFRKIPKGQIIFFSGDRRDRLFLLHRGYVRIEQYDSTDTFSYMDYIKMNRKHKQLSVTKLMADYQSQNIFF